MGLPEFSKSGEFQSSSSKKCELHRSIRGSFLKSFTCLAPAEANDDGDEPYTPFDDDDMSESPPSYNAPKPAVKAPNDDLEGMESQVEILNRQIEQRQLEIQSLAQQKAMELNEEQATRIYEKITVPHDLSEILSKINSTNDMKSMSIDAMDDDGDDEYVPTAIGSLEYKAASYSAMSQPAPILNSMMDVDERVPMFQPAPSDDQPSLLAKMTAADLMKLVPDGALEPPPAPIISGERSQQPFPIPGLEDEDYEME